MASHRGRLDRLGRAFGTLRTDERARLAEVYEGLAYCEREMRWPAGTATAIMEALLAEQAYTFATYDETGDRAVHRYGPFHRDQRGAIRWEWGAGCVWHEQLAYEASFADGLGHWIVSTRLPNGAHWDARSRVAPPSARELREMVVERARERDELALLEQGVGDVAAWLAAAPQTPAWVDPATVERAFGRVGVPETSSEVSGFGPPQRETSVDDEAGGQWDLDAAIKEMETAIEEMDWTRSRSGYEAALAAQARAQRLAQ